jgi:TIR domain
MSPDTVAARATPKAFISYSWDNDPHRDWVKAFGTRLRSDGVNVTLDQWHLQLGDQLPAFMERAVRENDYVLIVCTPTYADRSNRRVGGVGYEGDIMSGAVFTTRNERKFIPILRVGDWRTAAPTWLAGRYGVDLRGDPFSEQEYQDLFHTLHGTRPAAPPVIPTVRSSSPVAPVPAAPRSFSFKPVRILGVVVDEVSMPRMDGTRGSALYRVPFQLSRRPSAEWAGVFVHAWNHPTSFTTMHRAGIASVSGDKVYLDGTTMGEVLNTHRHTLLLALGVANREVESRDRQKFEREQEQARIKQEHETQVRETAEGIKFD